MQPRPILAAGQPLAQGRVPAVCAPLVARTAAALADETRQVAVKQPDLLEWRADFFDGISKLQSTLLQLAYFVRACVALMRLVAHCDPQGAYFVFAPIAGIFVSSCHIFPAASIHVGSRCASMATRSGVV